MQGPELVGGGTDTDGGRDLIGVGPGGSPEKAGPSGAGGSPPGPTFPLFPPCAPALELEVVRRGQWHPLGPLLVLCWLSRLRYRALCRWLTWDQEEEAQSLHETAGGQGLESPRPVWREGSPGAAGPGLFCEGLGHRLGVQMHTTCWEGSFFVKLAIFYWN